MSIAIDPQDNTGFIYYPTGAVCICSSPASDYNNSYYAFDKNRKGTILLGLENAIGFCCSSTRKSADTPNMTLVLTKEGCLISTDAVITHEWLWDRSASNCGVAPTQPVKIQLNEHIAFEFIDRQNMTLEYFSENVRYSFNLGGREKRTAPNYLVNATRKLGGGYQLKIDHVSLKMRQIELSETFAAQRNKIHPKSENLSEMVRDIVKGLELKFDTVSSQMKASPGAGLTWKSEALGSTLGEIPRIGFTGTETGRFSGFGEHIYTKTEDVDLSKSQTLPLNLMTAKGTWKDGQQIISSLREINPPLKRSAILKANSGRYSSSMVVNTSLVTADNPTGMVVPLGIPLDLMTWDKLKERNQHEMRGDNSVLTVALVTRQGDPKGCVFERVANVVNMEISASSGTAQDNSKKVKMYRIDVGENSGILNEIGIKELPTFLMYEGGHLLYAGPVGGRKVKMTSSSSRPQILIIEPNFKDQIIMEKTLKKLNCDTFICLNVIEAVERINQINGAGKSSVIFVDLVLISSDIRGGDYSVLCKRLAVALAGKRTVICGLVSILGDFGRQNLDAVKWSPDYTTAELLNILDPPLAQITHIAIQKPIKQNSILKALNMRILPGNESCFGLTPESLHTKIKNVREKKLGPGSRSESLSSTLERGPVGGVLGATYIGIRLSAEDCIIRGQSLLE